MHHRDHAWLPAGGAMPSVRVAGYVLHVRVRYRHGTRAVDPSASERATESRATMHRETRYDAPLGRFRAYPL